jgi:EF hand
MRHSWFGVIIGLSVLGCDSSNTHPREASVPKYDSEAIVQAAMAEFDKNKDGVLDGSELNSCPALQSSFQAIDTDRDRKLSQNELRARFERYAASTTGSVGVTCIIQYDGQSLADATVTFVPESCMGSVLKTAMAKTDARGTCGEFQIEGKTFRGLAAGLYRIQITKDGVAIPSKYNVQTILGREVIDDPRAGQLSIELNLTSR